MAVPPIEGFGHMDLTVTDGERSARWWIEVMGFKLLAKWHQPTHEGWTMVHPSGLAVTVMTHNERETVAFDERRVGLDHVAFNVGAPSVLEAWASHLDAAGALHSGIQDVEGGHGGPLIVIRDPDNIQVELTAGWQYQPPA